MSSSDSPHHHSLAAPFMLSLCVSLYSNIVLLSASQRLSALCIECSAYRVLYCVCLLCSTADVLYSSTNNVFFLWSLQHSDLGWSVCLLTTLCCLLVCYCMFRAGRVDVKGWSRWRQVRRGCMVSAGRSLFWCLLVGAESERFCGRNGRWKGLIFRHNRVHVLNQGAVLKKSSLRGVHPGDFPSRQGENERRPISCAHSSWIKRSTLLSRKMTRVHPVVSFPPKLIKPVDNRKEYALSDEELGGFL